MRFQGVASAGGGPGVGIEAPGIVTVPGGSQVVGRGKAPMERVGGVVKFLGWRSRAEAPNSPQMEDRPGQIPSWSNPQGLTPVLPNGGSWRETRLPDVAGVDPWRTKPLKVGVAVPDGGLNYGPPPGADYSVFGPAFRIVRVQKQAVMGWAGLQQHGYVQDQRGGANGYGAYIPHPGQAQPTRGWRSVSMARVNSPRPFSSDRVHVPAIFVPTAPIS